MLLCYENCSGITREVQTETLVYPVANNLLMHARTRVCVIVIVCACMRVCACVFICEHAWVSI